MLGILWNILTVEMQQRLPLIDGMFYLTSDVWLVAHSSSFYVWSTDCWGHQLPFDFTRTPCFSGRFTVNGGSAAEPPSYSRNIYLTSDVWLVARFFLLLRWVLTFEATKYHSILREVLAYQDDVRLMVEMQERFLLIIGRFALQLMLDWSRTLLPPVCWVLTVEATNYHLISRELLAFHDDVQLTVEMQQRLPLIDGTFYLTSDVWLVAHSSSFYVLSTDCWGHELPFDFTRILCFAGRFTVNGGSAAEVPSYGWNVRLMYVCPSYGWNVYLTRDVWLVSRFFLLLRWVLTVEATKYDSILRELLA